LYFSVIAGMGGAGAADRATGTGQSFVHDLADRAGATAALGATAETTIDLAGGTRRRFGAGGAYFMVTQHIAGADDHLKPGGLGQLQIAL
jgi:hypothetical protein